MFFFSFAGGAQSSQLRGSQTGCQKLYEWTLNTTELINEVQYYPFVLEGNLGTYTLPVFDNANLTGEPVARLRGNMITDPTGTDFTATATMFFYESQSKSHLGVEVSYTYNPEDDFVYGYTIGGTGRYQSYHAEVTSVVIATEPKFTVEWTFCSSISLF